MQRRVNWGTVCRDLEDYLAPLLGMNPAERTMYSHLLRHSQLEGRPGLMISTRALALGVGLQLNAAKLHLFALARKGCVRVKRWRKKYAVEVFLPAEVARNLTPENWTSITKEPGRVSRNPTKREAILRRERGRCFYCLRKLPPDRPWFDHVVPLSQGGSPAEDNIVASCERCNRWKHAKPASFLLEQLRRAKVITPAQLADRKRALRKLQEKWRKQKAA